MTFHWPRPCQEGKGVFLLPVRLLLSEKAMAPHSSTLAWKIPWTEEPGGLQSMGSLRVGHGWATSLSLFTFMHIGEENGNPLQCSCLENPREEGAWWAAIYEVAQSRTWLKQLSSSSSIVAACESSPCWSPDYLIEVSTPVLLPGKCHGWGSLVGYSPWGHKERLHFHFLFIIIIILPFLPFDQGHSLKALLIKEQIF